MANGPGTDRPQQSPVARFAKGKLGLAAGAFISKRLLKARRLAIPAAPVLLGAAAVAMLASAASAARKSQITRRDLHQNPATAARPFVLFYDGSCGLCRKIADIIQRHRSRHPLRCVDVTDDDAMAEYPQIDRATGMQSVILLEPDGRQRFAYDASAATIGLLKPLGGLEVIMRIIGIRHAGALAYELVTKHRHEISRRLGLE